MSTIRRHAIVLLRHARSVWLLNAFIAGSAAVLWWHLREQPSATGAVGIPWWALAVAFVVTELAVVHVHFRRSAHTLTLGEVPLVVGLLHAAPADVVLAWVVGAAVVLIPTRGHAAVRLAFNLAQFALTAGVAAGTFVLLDGSLLASGPGLWALAAAGTLVSAAVSAVLVGAAMRLTGEQVGRRRLAGMVAAALAIAATNVSLGLAVATVLASDVRAVPLLLAPAAAVLLAYRAYTVEQARHRSLEMLFETSRTLSLATDRAGGLAGVLSLALETFRAEVAEVTMFPVEAGEPGSRVAVGPGNRLELLDLVSEELVSELRDRFGDSSGARLLDVTGDGPLARHLRGIGARTPLLAPLHGERGVIGVMLLANRLGVGGAFDADERRLFETLASHTAGALGQDRLERRLDDLRALQHDLEQQAFHDPLTGLANRLLLHDRTQHALSRRAGNVALIYIDLDDFKAVNDGLGHEAGDALLVGVGDRLRETLRTADTPARLGGDEFAVLLTDISEEHARIVADRILQALAEPVVLGERELPIKASLGIALADAGSADADALIRNADIAMYVSKHGGKGAYRLFDAGMAATGAGGPR